MIENHARWGLARTSTFTVDQAKVATPAIALFEVQGAEAPHGAEIVSSVGQEGTTLKTIGGAFLWHFPGRFWIPSSYRGEEEVDDACGLVTISGASPSEIALSRTGEEIALLQNSFELRRDPRAYVKAVAELRRRIGPRPLIFAPGIMDVSNLALLAYSGVDIVDSSLIDYQGLNGFLSTSQGWLPSDAARWLPAAPLPDVAVSLNRAAAVKELSLVRHMISTGRIRELAELRSNASPWGVAALRLLDIEEQGLQERFVPVTGPRFYANSRQSLSRPDILRYRKWIMERYRPAPHKKVLLLIPCSAKKPYFTSKSHKALRSALTSVPNHEVVQELIVTSPIGVVPRELELFYPAAQYDIPVTGHWDREEVAMVQEMVKHVASGFDTVIADLGVESEFVKAVVDCDEVSDGRPTSQASLGALVKHLQEVCEKHPPISSGKDRAGSLASTARFQFGEGGEHLLDDCSVSGLYPVSKILCGGMQLGMLSEERGMISLTMEGGERILQTRHHWVETEDFELKGNLFCRGVRDADPGLRAGQEALVLRNGGLVAVGVAQVGAADMLSSDRGLAVVVRHKRKG
ncbi:MAG TPA: DUF5591 domain-containing protein [Methanomassiliicoccales archaeon]|nr:DUF5591 domain-containing protein [Methanomassiliicoccales archaeon]